MKLLALLGAAAIAATGCGDSTDISGDYTGNATYTVSDGAGPTPVLAGAQAAEAVLTDTVSDDVDVILGEGCELSASELRQVDVEAKDHSRFVFTSESLEPGATCTLPLGSQTTAISLVQGDLIVDAGGTLTLELGGTTGSDGYAVYRFDGAL